MFPLERKDTVTLRTRPEASAATRRASGRSRPRPTDSKARWMPESDGRSAAGRAWRAGRGSWRIGKTAPDRVEVRERLLDGRPQAPIASSRKAVDAWIARRPSSFATSRQWAANSPGSRACPSWIERVEHDRVLGVGRDESRPDP